MIIELTDSSSRATISTIGATIMSWAPGGSEILDGYLDETELKTLDGYRGAVLAPWSNRIAAGQWNDHGTIRSVATAGNDDPLGLHGLVFLREFEIDSQDESSVVLTTLIEPTSGYPYRVHLTVSFSIEEHNLQVQIKARNDSDDCAPIGLGWHPYFMRGQGTWDMEAMWVIENDDLGIPLPDPFTDFHGFEDVVPQWDNALAGIRPSISFPVRGGQVAMTANLPSGKPGMGIWHIFGGATLARGAGQSVAVEPCTAMTDALNRLREELDVVPGGSVDLTVEVAYVPSGS